MKLNGVKIKKNTTIIDNSFIDELMPEADGDFVKVYLYMLRHLDEGCSVEDVSAALDMTDRKVKRAVKYWQNAGALEIEEEPVHRTDQDPVNEGEFEDMMFVIQTYLPRTDKGKLYETFGYFYEGLRLPSDVIIYLVELCLGKKKTALRYMEKIALAWHSKGINTLEAARADNEIFSEEMSAVERSFGLSGLLQDQQAYTNRWFREWGFSKEMVEEACKRTVLSQNKANFPYADGILKAWYGEGIKTPADVKKKDEEFKSGRRTGAAKENASEGTRLNEIKMRYDALLAREKDEQQQRIREVYEKEPRIKELDEKIATLGITYARRAISSGGDVSDYRQELDGIKIEKAKLLVKAGFDDDYMDMRYTCKDCKDTGFIGSEKCHCFRVKEEQ